MGKFGVSVHGKEFVTASVGSLWGELRLGSSAHSTAGSSLASSGTRGHGSPEV